MVLLLWLRHLLVTLLTAIVFKSNLKTEVHFSVFISNILFFYHVYRAILVIQVPWKEIHWENGFRKRVPRIFPLGNAKSDVYIKFLLGFQ